MVDAYPLNPPSCCAGLRQALLHDWQHGFPLHDSPFQVLARQLGATLREVLQHCQALEREGALEAIRLRWGAAMQQSHWRCAQALLAAPGSRLQADLQALPGVVEWLWAEPLAARALPLMWFDLLAHDREAAHAQRSWFEARHGALECVVLAPPAPAPATGDADGVPPCACESVAGGRGPCQDRELARRCEGPLPLVAHPYRALCEGLPYTEREVLLALRRWQAAGLVQDIGLWPSSAGHTRHLLAALVPWTAHGAPPIAALLARPGISEVLHAPAGAAAGRPALLVCASSAQEQAAGTLERALAAVGLPARSMRLHRVHRQRLRAGPQYFTPIATAAAGAAAGLATQTH